MLKFKHTGEHITFLMFWKSKMHTTTSLLISFLMYSNELVLTGSHAFCLQCLTYFHLLLTGCNYWQVAGQREVLEYDVKYDMTCQEVIIIMDVGSYNSNIMVPPFLGEVIPRKLCHMLQKKLMWTLQNSLEAKRSCYKSLTKWNSCVIMIMF